MGRNLSVTAEEKRALTGHFPLIEQISNEECLRDRVIEAWVRVWRESGYQDIGDTPNWPSENDSLVAHTNAVARMTLAAAGEYQQVYQAKLSRDFLLAGALLHDIDKMVVVELKGGVFEPTELGRKVIHGAYGAQVAEDLGLPPEVVNIIASHSFLQPSAAPGTIEAILLACCDQAAFQAHRLMTGKGLVKKES